MTSSRKFYVGSPAARRRQRRRVVVSGFVGLAVAGLTAFLAFSRHEPARAVPTPEAVSVARPTSELEHLAEKNAARLAATRQQLQKTSEKSPGGREGGVGPHSQEALRRAREEAEVIHGARRMFNRDELEARALDALVADRRQVELALDLAADPRLAEQAYGADQAFMRVHALRVLRHLAKKGEAGWVGRAVDRVGQQLNAAEVWEKGVEHDYVELASSYLRAEGLDSVLADPQHHFRRLHLTARTSVELQRAFWDSGIVRGAPPEKLAALKAAFSAHLEWSQSHG